MRNVLVMLFALGMISTVSAADLPRTYVFVGAGTIGSEVGIGFPTWPDSMFTLEYGYGLNGASEDTHRLGLVVSKYFTLNSMFTDECDFKAASIGTCVGPRSWSVKSTNVGLLPIVAAGYNWRTDSFFGAVILKLHIGK